MLTLQTPLTQVPRITAKYLPKFKKLGLLTVGDLLFHFPFRYDDYTELLSISEIVPRQTATIEGLVTKTKLSRSWRKKMWIYEISLTDDSGTVRATWFNQPFLAESLIEGKAIRLSGKISLGKNGLYFSNPVWERASREPTNTGRLVPIYNETEGLTSRFLRWQIQQILPKIETFPDSLDAEILQELNLPPLEKALRWIHFPETPQQHLLARKRFAFWEMLLIQLVSLRIKKSFQLANAQSLPFNEQLIKNFVAQLPFQLTDAQRKAAFQILKDLEKSTAMSRLLNGDVGSGKTLVAAIATLNTASQGFQVAIIAPTEVLAQQHYENFCKLFKEYGLNIALLTNAYKKINSNFKFKISNSKSILNEKIKKPELLELIKQGEINVLIGTHALLQKSVNFHKLALVIIDEQHRFGVAQRAHLQKQAQGLKKSQIPHLLSMTATPIPRSLALVFFGNLDLSVLDQMPQNRKPIKTKIVKPQERPKAYEFIRQEIKKGRQAFVILPLVEESEALSEVKAAITEHARLQKEVFPRLKIGLLHGKLKAPEKEAVMRDFRAKKYDILVATTVIEVGIDIPNASVIAIEDAERFGLSQLHQLRGRVGRGQHQSYCLLFSEKTSAEALRRLHVLTETTDGFKIAEADLKLRGPGEFLGVRQSGLPDVSMENIANVKLLEISHAWAEKLLAIDPQLNNHHLLKQELARFNQDIHLE